MVSFVSPIVNNGALGFSQHPPDVHLPRLSAASFRRDDGDASSFAGNRTSGRVLTVPNVSSKKGSSNEVIMVGPLEAKQLAAKQMKEIQARKKFKRKCEIEAVNGAWAMIGLTVGLVIEGQTGKSIQEQLANYLGSFVHFIIR